MPLKAWLDGEQLDLQRLAALFSDGDVRVVRDDESGRYYLTATDLDGAHEDDSVYVTAETLLRRINGAARIQTPDYQLVTYAGRYTTANGDQVIQPASAELRLRVGLTAEGVVRGPDGEPQPAPPSPAVTRVALAGSNARVDKVLARMAGDLDWVNLFRIYELVRDAPKPASIVKMGWTTENKESAFTASANRPDVSGDDARHAVAPNTKLPNATMTLAEGQDWIRNLVSKWSEWLGNPNRPDHP
jgi:hypothetical protein